MRLIRKLSPELEYINRSQIISPDSPRFRFGLGSGYHYIEGLDELRRSTPACTDDDIQTVLRRGDWLLVDDYEPQFGGTLPARPNTPAPVACSSAKEPWPNRDQLQGIIFAKSCTPGSWGKTDAGIKPEPAEHFGKVMVAKSKPVPAGAATVAAAVGADAALGRIAGGGILQLRYAWMLKGVATFPAPAVVFIAGMLPTSVADGTLYSEDQLRGMDAAATRVRFQFRRDEQGVPQLYGIHTGESGDDSVPVVKAHWTTEHRTLQADLGDGISIIWTPDNGPLRTPELVYPQAGDERLGPILVHPIAEGTDTQIEVYPGLDDITLGDRIITFPADSGLRSLYVVFSRPLPEGHSYHRAPKLLDAFPEAMPSRSKGSVQGGGKQRARWKDRKGRIYEWDSQHGTIELYDKQGKHLGEFDPITGLQTKPPDARRRVEK